LGLVAAWSAVAGVALRAFVLLLATAHFYLNDLTGYTGNFWEELVETNGYFLFALAAWQHSNLIGDPEFDTPLEARG
jgi:hypothetical protein